MKISIYKHLAVAISWNYLRCGGSNAGKLVATPILITYEHTIRFDSTSLLYQRSLAYVGTDHQRGSNGPVTSTPRILVSIWHLGMLAV
jgi:hypothetical protein